MGFFGSFLITYDEIGNPVCYLRNSEFYWQGRRLYAFYNGVTFAAYTYNADGIRTSKNVDEVLTTYYLEGSRITGMVSDDTLWSFLYYGDTLIGFETGDERYYYRRNLQGDIIQIIDEDGEVVVYYTYDDWGKITDCGGILSGTLGWQNPFRYRGYVYDEETELYYVSSRYYDPEVGRFINADEIDYLGADEGLLSYNLFTYCLNNPVNRTDEGGNLSLPNWAKIAIGVAAIGIGVIATVATGGAATPALIAGVKTALVVGAISAGTSAATTALSSALNGDDIKTTAQKMMTSAVDGFCDGFMTGGIMAGASMTYGSLLKNANGIKIGTTDKSQYGRVNIGYGTPKTNGNTIISIQNNAGKSVFRLEADAVNMLHMHYGKTKAAMALHRTGIIRTIAGVISGVK